MARPSTASLAIFGGDLPWNPADWTAQDDTVRGSTSQSFLEIIPPATMARFYGNLATTLGSGAGFASQRTTTQTPWDLSAYDGLRIIIEKIDAKRYSFLVQDTLTERIDQQAVSWEFNFSAANLTYLGGADGVVSPGEAGSVVIPWAALTPVFNGQERPDEPPLKLESIRAFSIMCRTFFAEQQGEFDLVLRGIEAVKIAGAGRSDARLEKRNIETLLEHARVRREPETRLAMAVAPVVLVGFLLLLFGLSRPVLAKKVGVKLVEGIRGW